MRDIQLLRNLTDNKKAQTIHLSLFSYIIKLHVAKSRTIRLGITSSLTYLLTKLHNTALAIKGV